ncbi:MAG: gamma-glutamylcyclotransferase family protein [Thermacetogeniaceae bacterium]
MSDQTFFWYFAYGSNMDSKRLKERIGRFPERVPGVLRDWKLAFNKAAKALPGVGFANIVLCPGERVEGILYAVTKEELLKLDTYEGFPTHYERREVSVERRDTGEVVSAVTYIANPAKVEDGLKPTREYLSHLLAGADYLSKEYVHRLRLVETAD